MKSTYLTPAALLVVSANAVNTGYQLDLTDESSIKLAAKGAAEGLISYYSPNETDSPEASYIGTFPNPYSWDESGAAWDTLIHYWAYTGDDRFNKNFTDALVWQSVDGFMSANQTQSEGNDAQSNWALAALSAAERGLPDPTVSTPATANTTAITTTVSWLSLAQTVFETQVLRWDDETCNGGLRWSMFSFNSGYNYKSTLSNAQFFQLAARLAMFTGNSTYTQWAEKSYDWSVNTGFITEDYRVFDGAQTDDNCASVNKIQWSNNAGVYLYGSAVMYNVTLNPTWLNHTTNFLSSSIKSFTANDTKIIFESACEQTQSLCKTDLQAFKATFIRNLAATLQMLPFVADTIKPILQASAQGAAKSCTGDDNKCHFSWLQIGSTNTSDELTGLGEQMNAVEIFGANLVGNVKVLKNVNTTTSLSSSPSSSSSSGMSTGTGNGSSSSSPVPTQKSAAADGLALCCSLKVGLMAASSTLVVLMFL